MNPTRAFLFILSALCSTVPVFAFPAPQQDIIDIQLRWHHQFQFAGYYAAVEKGFYREEGLEVRLHPGDPAHQPVQEVLSGRVQYAEGNSEILFQRLRGEPLVALAAIFQHSPSILLVRKDSGIDSVHDLAGKKVMLMNRTEDADFLTMFVNEGISLSQIDIIPSSYQIDDLITRKVDAFNAYSSNEPFFLKQRGIPYNIIAPGNYRVDFYSDIFFTSEKELRSRPERVEKMLRATLKGWRYAMDHPDEIIDLLIRRYPIDKTRAHLEFEAAEMRKLIFPDLIEIGHMNPERWQHMADAFVKAGLVSSDNYLDGFLYSAKSNKHLPAWVIPVLGAGLAVIAFILASAYYLMQLNRRLASAQHQLHAVNRVLSEEIDERKTIEANLRISEKRYHSLFGNMVEGFAFCRMLYRNDQPDDIQYIEVNPAFETLTGLPAVAGKKVTEVVPGIKESNPEIFEIYGRVAAGGLPEKFEIFMPPLNLWFSVSAYHADTDAHCFITVIENITERKLLQRNYEQMAQTDYLTGLSNRRHFMQQAETELTRTLRYGSALSLLMLDLDHFKQINDNHGHRAGDKVLQTFSSLCRSILRQSDLVGRLGGEEFVIMLPETGVPDAISVAERLRKITEEVFVLLEDGQPLYFTVSIGIAGLDERYAHLDALLQKADQSLYKAKSMGRNRIHTDTPCSRTTCR
jgi:diguanylate cyclase (GGDEF)-like protein